jgi:peptide/nickel transport system permease protein
MRVVDIQLSFPAILIALILIAVLGQGTARSSPRSSPSNGRTTPRTARGAALVEKRKEYIEAAHCLALSPGASCSGTAAELPFADDVVATVQVAAAIALEATLSFLGLGPPWITEPWLGLLIANGCVQHLLVRQVLDQLLPLIAPCARSSAAISSPIQRDVLNPRLQR